MVHRSIKKNFIKKNLITSVVGMENDFHDINEYHSFVTKQMFLSEPETTMSISSEQNESYLIKSKMSDKE